MRNDTMGVLAMPKKKLSKITLGPQEALRLFRASADLMDAMEEILESRGAYGREFVRGLSISLQEMKQGKLRKINSLGDLS